MTLLQKALWITIILNTAVLGITIGMNIGIYTDYKQWETEKAELNYSFEEPVDMMEGLDWNGYYSGV